MLNAVEPYLLDTNIVVHQVRRDRTGEHIRQRYGLLVSEVRPIISVVTHGEIRSLIYQFGWGPAKVDQATFLLGYYESFYIESPELFEAYAVVDEFSRRLGISRGKNDLWIAATALVTGAVLMTTDRDFDHLPESLIRREFLTW